MTITIHVYRSGHSALISHWYADVPGACGAGATPWEALAEALAVWERRGRPTDEPTEGARGGADWVISRVTPAPKSAGYAYHVDGINLNCAPGTYGRLISWCVSALTDRRYEILPGAFEAGIDTPWNQPARAQRIATIRGEVAG